ncbi:MAG TPA: DUF1330 domain-containing protein [Xanthobacteraceae bacterium]|nr:DUF1330 domain-containing protein [Xanthobacteraceae bacterium]
MNTTSNYVFAAVLLAGVGIGSVLTTALRAQNPPPAYLVAEEAIHDMDTFTKEYGPKVPATLQPYGGRVIVRSTKLTALEGDAPPRFVIIAFESLDKARSWYDSPAYQQLVPIRQKASKSTLFIAEGLPN